MPKLTVHFTSNRGKCSADGCDRDVLAKKLCGKHYQRVAAHGQLTAFTADERFKRNEAKFWARVDKSGGPDACWPWLGTRDKSGYGKVRRAGKKFMTVAHRSAWEYVKGPIPEGLNVLHHCDNPPCCNSSHHFLGKDLDNATDRERKGRGNHAKGSRVGTSKLTEADIPKIRALRSRGATQEAIGRRFGVHQVTISKILLGSGWSHV